MDKNLIGASGTYFVMHKLSGIGVHASCTFGNAKHVDILAAAENGSRSISIQVKTAAWALRYRGRGQAKKEHHFEFPLGYKAANVNFPDLFFVFVDLKMNSDGSFGPPDCYVLSSTEVYDFCKSWKDEVAWVRFHPEYQWLRTNYYERWDKILSALE